LGITAIELAEGQVPNSHVKPFMAIFQIKSNPVQSLKDPSLWSPEFNDFVKQCLQVNPINRPDARELLDHAFIKKYSKGQRLLAELVLSSMQ
jgi:serine/threonine kinase 4